MTSSLDLIVKVPEAGDMEGGQPPQSGYPSPLTVCNGGGRGIMGITLVVQSPGVPQFHLQCTTKTIHETLALWHKAL